MNAESEQIKQSPFNANGPAYFGPQQLALSGGLKRALTVSDSALTLSGPVGSGKTTSILHALARIGTTGVIARIGRVYLERDDVLELLLDELRIKQMPASALQRFTALKQMLKHWASNGTNVYIVVEDVERLGVEALAELESLTAADGDETPGAHLILMGGANIREFLQQEHLARLQQRVRRNMTIKPYSLDETKAYLSHRLSNAGDDLEQFFDEGAVEIVHGCSGGITRLINNVAESMLEVAAEAGSARVSQGLARQIAQDDFDFVLDGGQIDDSPSRGEREPAQPQADCAPAAAHEEPRQAPTAEIDALAANLRDETDQTPNQDVQPPRLFPNDAADIKNRAMELESWREKTETTESSLPVLRIAPSEEDVPEKEDRPQYLKDEGERLQPRAPEPLSKASESADTQTRKALDDALRPDTQLLMSLDASAFIAEDDAPVPIGLRDETPPRATGNSTSGVDRTDGASTATEIDTRNLKKPAASSQPASTEAEQPAIEAPTPTPASTTPASVPVLSLDDAEPMAEEGSTDSAASDSAELPQITLDSSLDSHKKEAKEKLAEEARQLEAAAIETDDAESDEELKQKEIVESLSARFSGAKSLEDVVDDDAAETLFGEEFSQMAAAVSAMEKQRQAEISGGDSRAPNPALEPNAGSSEIAKPAELSLVAEEQPAATPPTESKEPRDTNKAGAEKSEKSQPSVANAAGKPASPDSPASGKSANLDSSPSQRLRMVRALNGKAGHPTAPPSGAIGEEIVLGESTRLQVDKSGENKANTISRARDNNSESRYTGDDDEPKKKDGFLSRFRRS